MSNDFTNYVKILGRGKKGARSLTVTEAEHAMSLMLAGKVAPEQSGAFWMLIRIREETVEETVGFTKATRAYLSKKQPLGIKVDLDWPAYAGKRNELPWFLLAALALSNTGVKIVMHGHTFEGENRWYVEHAISQLGLAVCQSREDVKRALETTNFAYLPLAKVDPMLGGMMNLKYVLGLRSPVNTVVRMMNPFFADHSVHGVFHRGYDQLHLAACEQLGDASVLVFRGGNGEAEVNPERDVTLGKWQHGMASWSDWPKAEKEHKRLKDNLDLSRLTDHWRGDQLDQFGEQAVRQTIASVAGLLYGVASHEDCLVLADDIWAKRDRAYFDSVA
ncbi:glycosyl transferase family protein [Marinomonas sp. M1K-6]|uniref:Glycosyl transferase family protein n=2 Tax=Marinomonas profundi TaxID=2726122 RepID=A0A847R792_9GAMM|nr:glycosyl transferase family protein [Marinomonas profundi]NLQ16130.1 glycosyl transferase family protein [Marinomonas profundi]UDV04771.1 glycosyl transferase family protein [Marinomonas profundi]